MKVHLYTHSNIQPHIIGIIDANENKWMFLGGLRDYNSNRNNNNTDRETRCT